MIKEKILNTLTDLGLKKTEAKIYLYLSKKGPKKAKEITNAIGVTKQRLYPLLKELQNKAIINSSLARPAKFEAISYEKLLDLFANKKLEEAKIIQQNKKEILLDWKSISNINGLENYPKFSIIKGRKFIHSKIMQMIQETKKSFSFIAPLPDLIRIEQYGVLDVIENIPKISKAEFRFLTDLSSQKFFDIKTIFKEVMRTDSNFIYRNHDLSLQLSPRMVIRDGKETLVYITKHPDSSTTNDETCLFTDCTELVKSFNIVFDELWINSTDIKKIITQINSNEKIKTQIFNNSRSAHKKHEEILNLAIKKIFILTSTEGLIDLKKNLSLLKELSLKDVSIQIMAPITSKNLEVANQFSKYFEVRHVPVNYLKITIVDAEHMFQSRATYENNNYYFPQFLDSYYTNNQEYISNRKKVLTNLWKTSKPPSFVTLKAVSKYSESKMSSQPYKLVHDTIKQIDGPIIVKEEKSSKKLQKTEIIKLSNYAKRHPETNFSGGITRTYGVMGQAIVRPPRELNLPALLFIFLQFEKNSRFGITNILQVFVKQKKLRNSFLPVIYLNDNPKMFFFHKQSLAGCFINDNLILTKKDNISIKLTGKNLFCGWSIDIPLPNDYVIPPCSILLEGYGKAKPNILEMQYPSGYKLWDAYNGIEAFVTFFHPLAKYSGPGTDGHIAKDNYQELYQPYSND